MEEIKRVKLPEELAAYLQMLYYEREGLRVLNAQLIRSGDNAGPGYEHFLEEYRRACAAFGAAYDLAAGAHIPRLPGGEWVSEVNFLTGELIARRREGA